MPGLIDEVFVRIRPEIAGFAAETTAGIRGALAEVNAQVATAAKANVATAGMEVDANKAVADSYLGIAEAAQAPVRSMEEIKAAAAEQMATVASVAKANVDALVVERDANLQLAASYQTVAKAAIRGSEQQIAASKLAAEAALKAGVVVKGVAIEEGAAFSGVKSRILSLGNVIGVAFGAAIGVALVKNVVNAAATMQKSVEVIRSQFGAAGKSLIDFANTAGIGFGAINTDTLAASAQLGILFQNVGIAPRLAAQMTKSFEQVALATNSIKGGSSAAAAQLLQLVAKGAATGRGLNRLGIIVTTAAEKNAYFALTGQRVIGTLTAQQKAIGIYGIVLQHLPERLRQAALHSHDLSDVSSTLTAEWAKAKQELGTALLPTVKKYATELVGWLHHMERSGQLQKDFNSIAGKAKDVISAVVGAIKVGVSIWNGFSDAVGGSKNAIVILLGAMAASKFASVVNSVKGTASTILGLGKSALMASARIGVAFRIIDAEAIATGLTMKVAILSTGIGAIIVGIGIATAYIVTHWDQVKRWTVALGAVMAQIWHGITGIIIGSAKLIAGGIVDFLIFPMKEFIDVAASAVGWIPFLGDGVKNAAAAVDGLFNSMKNLASNGKDQIVQGASDIGNVGQAWSDSMAKSASSPSAKAKAKKAGQDVGQSFNNGLGDAVASGASDLTKPLKPVLDQLHNAIQSAKSKIHQTVMDAKDNLVKIGDELAKTIERIQAKIGGAAGALAGSPQGQAFAKLKHLIESGAPSFEIARARAALSSQLQNVGKTQPLIKTQLDDLTGAFNRGKITYGQFQERLHKILREDGVTMAQALKIGGSAFANTMKAQVDALGKQARAIADIPAKFRGIGRAGGAADIKIIRPLQVIQQEQVKIAHAAERQRHQQIRYAHEMAKYQAKLLLEQQQQDQRERVAHAAAKAAHAAKSAGDATGVHRRADLSQAPAGPQGPIGPHSRADLTQAPAGPQGPLGQVRTHLDRIHAGIVHETTVASAQRKQHLGVLQHISGEIGRLGGEFAAVEQSHVARPLNVLHQDNVRIASRAEQQRDSMLKAQHRTNAELRSLRRHGATPPGFGKYPPGKGSKDARMAAATGTRV